MTPHVDFSDDLVSIGSFSADAPRNPIPAGRDRTLVAVTGATGNLGRELVTLLLARGYRVRGQFRNSVPRQANVEWVRLDFADPALSDQAVRAFVAGATAVINLAASTSKPEEMEAANVVNLERLARAGAECGVTYFGQASSMVVYGSPRESLVTESSPRIDPATALERQYFAEPVLRDYARTKRVGEDSLARFADAMHIDLYRIGVAGPDSFMTDSLNWSRKRQVFALYRNSHFMTSRDTVRAIVHLMEYALAGGTRGIEAYNVCNRRSPTYAQFYRQSGRRTGFHIPLVFDLLKNWTIGRTLSLRRPMGAFRLDDAKLTRTGFVH